MNKKFIIIILLIIIGFTGFTGCITDGIDRGKIPNPNDVIMPPSLTNEWSTNFVSELYINQNLVFLYQ